MSREQSLGGHLMANGRFAKEYDEVGPCLGTGGMGSVWAARRGDGASCSIAPVGAPWVAVKAIPIECDRNNSIQLGLQECLSTFRDLSPVHVVCYERFWLEEPDHLPEELRQIFHRTPAPVSSEAVPVDTELSQMHGMSQRFLDGCFDDKRCSGDSFCPMTPLSAFSDNCGFVWEDSESISRHSLVVRSPRRRPFGGGLKEDDTDLEKSSPSKSPIASLVLLIEMELMCQLPSEISKPCSGEERFTLRTWLQRHERTLSDAADVFGCIIAGVRHIHRKRLVHADLKPDNIFCVVARGLGGKVIAARIGDFGLAGENQLFRQSQYVKGVFERKSIGSMGGTPGYAAPEILLGDQRRSEDYIPCTDKVDIFACAVIFLELLVAPFATQMERMTMVTSFSGIGGSERVLPGFVQSRLPKTRALLQEMSERDPKCRICAEEVCKRFDKQVKKELYRSGTQQCADASAPVFTEKPEPRLEDKCILPAGKAKGRRRSKRGR